MTTDEEWDRLERVMADWPRVFGESLPFGFDVTVGDLDLLERCLRARSKREFNAMLKRRHSSARAY